MPRRFNTCGEPAGKGGAVDPGADRSTAYRGAAFIGAVTILYLAFLAATGQVAQLVDALRAVQAPWLLAACASMLLYLVLGVAAYAVAVWCDPASPVGVRDLVSVEASGIFFGNLTPMMVGSTPAQIYRLTKAGQSVGEAGAVQFTRFMVYQFGLVAWSALLMAFRLPFFIDRCGDIALLCAAAFGMHTCILGGILAVGLLPGPIARAARAAIDLAARLGAPASRTEAWRAFVDREVESFSHTFRTAAGHVGSMAATVAITILQLAFFYLVPLLLMLAFGRSGVDVLTVMAASSFVQLLSSAVPLPGGTGGRRGRVRAVSRRILRPCRPRRLSDVEAHHLHRADDRRGAPSWTEEHGRRERPDARRASARRASRRSGRVVPAVFRPFRTAPFRGQARGSRPHSPSIGRGPAVPCGTAGPRHADRP